MNDVWIEQEWESLCQRLMRTARRYQTPANEQLAERFARQEPPERYPHLLDRVRQAAQLAVSWQESESPPEEPEIEDVVVEAGIESFPASDPPAWTAGTASPTRT